MVKNLLKVIHILEGMQQAEHLRVLNTHVWAAVNKDQWLTVWKLEADVEIPKTVVSEILM